MNPYDIQPGLPVTPAESRKWYQIWWEVWRYPGADTFRSILTEPNTTTGRGSLWILLTAFASSILSTIMNLIFMSSSDSVAITLACSFIGVPIGAVIGLYISTAIYHGVSRLFGSSGKFDHLFFCFAAIQAPETVFGMIVFLFYPFIISAINMGSFAAIGIPLLCLLGFGLLLTLYSLVLFVYAVAGAENISIGKAVAAVLAPTFAVLVLMTCFGVVVATSLAKLYQ